MITTVTTVNTIIPLLMAVVSAAALAVVVQVVAALAVVISEALALGFRDLATLAVDSVGSESQVARMKRKNSRIMGRVDLRQNFLWSVQE